MARKTLFGHCHIIWPLILDFEHQMKKIKKIVGALVEGTWNHGGHGLI